MISIPERLHTTRVLNRDERRDGKNRGRLNPNCVPMENSVIAVFEEYHQAEFGLNVNIKDNECLGTDSITGTTIFRGEGTAYPFFTAVRDISVNVARSKLIPVCDPHQEWLAKLQFPDYYRFSVNGLSLADIETMSLPLSSGNIARITGVLREPTHGEFLPGDQTARRILLYGAIDSLAHPEKAFSSSANKLRDRLQAYFDFYAQYLYAENADYAQDLRFAKTLEWAGNCFGEGLGLYVAASEGLSPSSVMKLFQEHLPESGFGFLGNRAYDTTQIQNRLQYAFYNEGVHSLPPELHQYLHYYPEIDAKISKTLIQPKPETSFGSAETTTILDKLFKYKGTIVADSAMDDLAAPIYQIDHPVVSDVALGFRSSKSEFNGNITLVLIGRDETSHLTLDITFGQRLVYGIPRGLSEKVPHMEERLIETFVRPIIDQVEARHPELLPRERIEVQRPRPVAISESQPVESDEEIEIDEVPLPTKPPKRKQLAQAFGWSQKEELQLPDPQPATSNQREYYIDYNEEMVREYMGKGVRSDEVLQIMRALKRVELGAFRSRKVETEPGISRVKSGNWRIKIYRLGGRNLELIEVVRRDKAYE